MRFGLSTFKRAARTLSWFLIRPTAFVDHRLFMRLYTRHLRSVGFVVRGVPLYVSARATIDHSRPELITFGDRSVVSSGVRILTHDFAIDRSIERRDGRSDDEFKIDAACQHRRPHVHRCGLNPLPGRRRRCRGDRRCGRGRAWRCTCAQHRHRQSHAGGRRCRRVGCEVRWPPRRCGKARTDADLAEHRPAGCRRRSSRYAEQRHAGRGPAPRWAAAHARHQAPAWRSVGAGHPTLGHRPWPHGGTCAAGSGARGASPSRRTACSRDRRSAASSPTSGAAAPARGPRG